MRYKLNVCKCSCPRLHDDLRNWCQHCRDEWERDQEVQAELRRLIGAYLVDAAVQPATVNEWAQYWDETAPMIEELCA